MVEIRGVWVGKIPEFLKAFFKTKKTRASLQNCSFQHLETAAYPNLPNLIGWCPLRKLLAHGFNVAEGSWEPQNNRKLGSRSRSGQ